MKLLIIHGAERLELNIAYDGDVIGGPELAASSSSETNDWTVLRLKKEIEKLLNIEPCHQRLIYKGKTIIGDDLPLAHFKLKSGDKLMVLTGSKPAEMSQEMKRLQAIEKVIYCQMRVNLTELESSLDGIEKGFVPSNMLGKALNVIEKQQRRFAEDCMKILEELDGIAIGEEAKSAIKVKRKCLVNDVQNLLSQHDKMADKLSYIKLESQPKALTYPIDNTTSSVQRNASEDG